MGVTQVNIPKPTYTKNDIGLGNVDNTSDLNKPISTATQTALDGKVDKVTGKGLSENDFTDALKTTYDDASAWVTDVGLDLASRTTNTNSGDETESSILSKLGWFNIINQTAGTASSGTSNTITKSIPLPSVPSILNFRAVFSKTGGAGTFTVRAYLSDVDNNIGGTAILIGTITSTAGNVLYLPMKRTTDLIGGNAIGLNASQTALTDDFQTTAARLNTAYPTGTPLYLIFAVQCANGSDSAKFESCMINNFTF